MKIKYHCWLVALLAFPIVAHAAGFDVTAGASMTSADHATVAVFASAFGTAPVDGQIHIAPIGTIGWLGAHNTHRDNLHHDVFTAAGGLRLDAPRRHWFVSEQLAATSAVTGALSSHIEFMTSVGWQNWRFIVLLRHISDANLFGGGKNLGETMLLAGVKW